MKPHRKTCPFCGRPCPPKALRCRGCDQWFPVAQPRRRSLSPWRIFGGIALLLLLRNCYLAANRPPEPPPFDVPKLTDETAWEHELRRRAEGLRLGIFHTETCPLCKGRGYIVPHPVNGLQEQCWFCHGLGIVIVGD